MQFITIGVLTALSALLAMGPTAKAADTVLFAGIDTTPAATLAWAGENETFSTLSLVSEGKELPQGDLDVKLMTGLAAPEPPAIVLAGMALGGLICGRSFLQKKRRNDTTTKETT